jgi:hypothetical protein
MPKILDAAVKPIRGENGACRLCGLPYTRWGNNPAPLASTGRCCDACDEIVIEARIDPARVMDEIERVSDAILRMPHDDLHAIVIAAICASRGPGLLAEKQRLMAQLNKHPA